MTSTYSAASSTMPSRVERILVTGATGFVGQACCKYLVSSGYKVRALVRNSANAKALPAAIKCIEGDLAGQALLEQACSDVDAVVHLAGIAHVNHSDEESLQATIVQGTRNLLAAAARQEVRRFIYLSSSLAVAAEAASSDATKYGFAKLEAERLVHEIGAKASLDAVVLRPVNVYGLGMKGNIAGMISLISRRLLPPLPQTDSCISLIGVDDLARAIELALLSEAATGKTYVVSDGKSYSISALEQAIYEVLGRKIPGWRIPRMLLYVAAGAAGMANRVTGRRGGIGLRTYRNLVSDNVFSSDLIAEELGFSASTTLFDELPAIVGAIVDRRKQD